MGIINFYKNDDFNSLFPNNEKFYFKSVPELTRKIDLLDELAPDEIITLFDEIKIKLQENSLNTLSKRLKPYL